jgi:uncharacterized protein YbcI
MDDTRQASAGDLRAAVSNGIVAAMKRLYGKGPERARTYFDDEYVFCVMEGGLTPSEQTLCEAGEHRLVRQYRLRFQEVVKDDLVGIVEGVTGRTVVGYHSQIVFDPTRLFEVFALDAPAGE